MEKCLYMLIFDNQVSPSNYYWIEEEIVRIIPNWINNHYSLSGMIFHPFSCCGKALRGIKGRNMKTSFYRVQVKVEK